MGLLTVEQIGRLKELAGKATPGPWITDDPPGHTSVWRGKWFGLICDCQSNSTEQDHVADARFIAAASPDVVAQLAAEWEAQREALQRIAEPGNGDLYPFNLSREFCADIARSALAASSSPTERTA